LIKLLEEEVEIRCLREDESIVRELIGVCER
jgi:V-type H+-transporting ATPase subunit E